MATQAIHPLRLKTQENRLQISVKATLSSKSLNVEKKQKKKVKPIDFIGVMIGGSILALCITLSYLLLYPMLVEFMAQKQTVQSTHSLMLSNFSGIVGVIGYVVGAFFFFKGLIGLMNYVEDPRRYPIQKSITYMVVSTLFMMFPTIQNIILGTL